MSEIETPFGEPLPDMTEDELDTAVEVMREEEVMAWANSVDWTVDDLTKTLIIGNVRGFAASPHNITNQFITKFAATINARSQELAAELTAEVARMRAELARERQFICKKCGLRQELGEKPEVSF